MSAFNPMYVVLLGLLVLVAGAAFIYWRKRSPAAAASAVGWVRQEVKRFEPAPAVPAAPFQLPPVTAATPLPPAPAAPDAAAWPHLIVVQAPLGPVTIMASAPLNPLFQPSLNAAIFGSQGHYIFDPSNGDKVGQPLRSAAGFPLFYAIAAGQVVGTPSVLFGDQSFNSDAEVMDYIARTTPGAAQTAASKAQWDTVQARMREQQPPTGVRPAGPADGDVAIPNA